MTTTIQNRGPELAAVASALCGVAFVATALRCYVRAYMLRSFGADDWIMIFAMIMLIISTACCVLGTKNGTGRHYWDLAPEGISAAMKYWWFCYILYAICITAAKVSIAVFLLRITRARLHNWIIYIATGLSIIVGCIFFFVSTFQCAPVEFFWNRTIPGGKCINIEIIIVLVYVISAITIITDFTYSLLPIFMVWHLQMDRKTKIALVPILSMACIASSAVCVRLVYVDNFRKPDFLWETTDIAIWSQTEQALAITAGSLATLRPLLRILLGKFGLLSRPQDYPYAGYGGLKKRNAGYAARINSRGGGSSLAHPSLNTTRKGPRDQFDLRTFKDNDQSDEPNSPREKSSGYGDDDSGLGLQYTVEIISEQNGSPRRGLVETGGVRRTTETICTSV